MKKTLITLATIACFPAFAQTETIGIYLGGQLGASILKANSIKDTLSYFDESETVKIGSFKNGKIAGALNIGYNFKYDYELPLRTELSFTIRGNSDKKYRHAYSDVDLEDDYLQTSDKHKVRMNTLMVNAYYDIETNYSITPFVGAGLGIAFTKLDQKYSGYYKSEFTEESASVGISDTKTKFAWNVAAGVTYNIDENVDIDFTARYVNAGKTSIKTNIEGVNVKASAKLSSMDFLAGIRYTF
ncbi:porin family protein [Gilliamella sp. B2776]|uniref:outer membrane protein n=1 Tax=unclassified Gilliamella TaxID=2685620 RepID=UPI00226A5F94|nr:MULTISPECIES: OmpW family outer membrane protein [unclassified Gilliamella]MCX8650294.1 porin family protein [Gilliamella sp. B2779]MCX8654155.1 porin family protein [Gilliamella sp. B2737]MCX8655988.1 porin family protein [Gilliamella sp. B2894]MCX8664091.1 porin family protein [Gilliamella sp. B2887]MCX8692067.1 porin family protein [Gilliamella sp. B2776]